ncbi:DNA-binding protein [Candidatus Bathyarchaeota archaeon A05DMB-2]|jgi:predicted DNA-binding protein with PD1-like motif|nr:DNA-binding protein [Candidatus Bathyarchaeota archaeon A05DMB-2]
MQFAEAKYGRVFILRLHDDDRLPDALESFAADQKISSALCFFIGGAKEKSRIVVGPKNDGTLPPEPMTTLLRRVHEACGLGTIFADEAGKPKLHMHASFGRKESTVTGCVRMGVDVWRIGEVVVLELLCSEVCRAVDKATGFEFLEIR